MCFTYRVTVGDGVCVLDSVALLVGVYLGFCFFWLCVSVLSKIVVLNAVVGISVLCR